MARTQRTFRLSRALRNENSLTEDDTGSKKRLFQVDYSTLFMTRVAAARISADME